MNRESGWVAIRIPFVSKEGVEKKGKFCEGKKNSETILKMEHKELEMYWLTSNLRFESLHK